ncbi:MAG TPA: hypothetical protein VF467_04300, partial [Afipia sp.]
FASPNHDYRSLARDFRIKMHLRVLQHHLPRDQIAFHRSVKLAVSISLAMPHVGLGLTLRDSLLPQKEYS